MIKIIFSFSKQIKAIDPIKKITSLNPTYRNFKQLNLSLEESLKIFDVLQQKQNSQSAKIVNNLLTYVRKVHNRSILRSRQYLIDYIIKNFSENDLDQLPALMANITYTENPELYISNACNLLIKNATKMQIKSISNCIYSIAKVARKNIQMDLKNEKLIAYNAAQLTLQNLIPIIQLKLFDCQDAQILMETLIAYQKLEIYDIHETIFTQLTKIQFNEFGRIQSQIAHTLSIYDIQSQTKETLLRSLYNCLEDAVHLKRLTLQSMIIGLHATFERATKDLIEQCMDIYCEEYKTANIQDLSMMTNVLFRKGIMSGKYSQILTESYEALKLNIDINVLNYIIPNMSTMINLQLLEKKFINQFLISIKILNEKNKINRKFYEQLKKETQLIQNEEIKDKFQQIKHKIDIK